ncbi:MAG: ATP F0F1 synthase subunit B [Rickettsiales bacterium]|nr:ATP F0F1 synthase subunit B [Rickettsiales bacterium]|tara:strand:- start:61 stop:552 length:492 start_codon:yes stop_codon:yes gene_type:complete
MDAFINDPATWVLVSFIGFMLIFMRYVLPHVMKGLDHRSEHIRSELEEAVKLKEHAQSLLTEYQRKQQEIHAEAEALLQQAKEDAAAMRSQAEADIQDMIARRTEVARGKIARAEMEAVADIRQHMAQVAVLAAQDILAEDAAKQKDDPYLDAALAQSGQLLH